MLRDLLYGKKIMRVKYSKLSRLYSSFVGVSLLWRRHYIIMFHKL